ncbi:glutaredoxin 3 [Paraglaciecola polaris]|uniref:glutaredoxin 3 n=1 Tax=Paraglaciecola polaris TaxID=222814 RepID=UPI0030ECA9B2
MNKVELYTKGHCPYCHRAKALLEQKGVQYTEFKVDVQPELRSEMITRANGGSTVPQIFIGIQHVGGCDDLFALESQNKLDTLLSA